MTDAVVIGGGPAGLMAAEVLARAGLRVVIAEAKPSVGRKLLMAGKSGLNITKDEPLPDLIAQYPDLWLTPMLTAFGPDAVKAWAVGLHQKIFTGSSRMVFPKVMKASPLLRQWLWRLGQAGVQINTRWRWTGWQGEALRFETPQGVQLLSPAVTVLALGGASWARLGSDGAWAGLLAARGVALAPFKPANMGLQVAWSDHMARHFGVPVKGVALIAGGKPRLGEFVVSARGLEGSGIYAVSRAVREGAPLTLDLAPGVTRAEAAKRLAAVSAKESLPNRLRKALRLDAVKVALLQEFGRPLPDDHAALAALIKALPVAHQGPRPIDEAISTAGGIPRAEMTKGLELKALPGVFACGEMLDWEAPTGGYLITACLATGHWAAENAALKARAVAKQAARAEASDASEPL